MKFRTVLIVFLVIISVLKVSGQSFLEVLNTDTGERILVKKFDSLIESPNWTPDGKYIIYNSGGKLYRIEPQPGSEPVMINTGFADRCNNDHVISADGKLLAVSHSTREDGKSRIYVLPAEGGNPCLITAMAPSYLHGWSPDGKLLTYCAERNGNYDIYIIRSAGGEELRITFTEGLDDGPEYSPDSKYIWFNSVRTGLMQIWRMEPDGEFPVQMTSDSTRNSWFPHVSPDGKKILFIAYKKGDLLPNQHLAGKNVEIRMMSSEGGTPVTLVSFFGGQGSFNVNSWAPDSKRAAFVSYGK